MTQFSELGLAESLLTALAAKGYTTPTPIQAKAIPQVLEGRDLLGIAATGTGKTAAFALPILDRLTRNPLRTPRKGCRALILSPTRELTAQIAESFRAYGANLNLRVTMLIGGMPMRPQTTALSHGVDIVVATPGRLLDHIEQGNLKLDGVEVFVLDEADHMLDLGFIPAIRRTVRMLPKQRQNLFFSATMPKEIAGLAADMLRDPAQVSVTPTSTPAERIAQTVVYVDQSRKAALLAQIVREKEMARTLVFARTKHGCDKIVRSLNAAGIDALAIHGNKSQSQRMRALALLRSGEVPVLIATDIAARGIDIDAIGLVVNYDLPHVPETYVHRIGRTARAGAEGEAVAFCSGEEKSLLRAIENVMRVKVPVRIVEGLAELKPAPAAPRGEHQSQKPRPHSSNKPRRDDRAAHAKPRRDERAAQEGPRKAHTNSNGEQHGQRSEGRRDAPRHGTGAGRKGATNGGPGGWSGPRGQGKRRPAQGAPRNGRPAQGRVSQA